ncbi:hypothetical protein [Nocardioides allogilvus]|uniref:hypothetical protein n=1 Tax=Nocardioides allogilvus TaxID=2072017 RepID=UPI000D3231AD|nr:hypothetical protein [Nocardioides allogilvus]
MTATLHIEHPISDLATWSAAFSRFAEHRRQAGVLAERILQPEEDPAYVVVDLDFADAAAARAFRSFLEQRVWSDPASSPALRGAPLARVLVKI